MVYVDYDELTAKLSQREDISAEIIETIQGLNKLDNLVTADSLEELKAQQTNELDLAKKAYEEQLIEQKKAFDARFLEAFRSGIEAPVVEDPEIEEFNETPDIEEIVEKLKEID